MRNAMPELAVKYPGDMPLMLVIWSPEEIQALADGMEISLTGHEIRTVRHAWRTSRKTSGLSRYFFRCGDGDYPQRERKPPGDRPC